MLHDFILANRAQIIDRARRRVRERAAPESSAAKLENGIPLFLTQLADALMPIALATRTVQPGGTADSRKRISDSAALHGHELLRSGFTVAQVVHGYGDVCQIVTELATETNAPISADDFHTFNRCLDEAIAGAVTAYERQRERDLAYEGTERFGVLAHELRNLVQTAVISFDVIKKGQVGLGGSTGAMHSRTLAALGTLAERSFAEIRLETGKPRLERVALAAFIEEVEITAAMQAEGFGLDLTVNSVDSDVLIDADWQLLSSAVFNLLQNAFKFTRAHGKVALVARATDDSVFLEVHDECGGLPPGKAENLFRPFTQEGADRSGLGLGLSIARSAARANAGDVHVRNVPGTGCVFTIEMPRQSSRARIRH